MKITLKAARHNAGFTQTQAGQKLGVNRMTIAAWEAGTQTPRLWRRPQIAAAYGLEEYQIIWKED